MTQTPPPAPETDLSASGSGARAERRRRLRRRLRVGLGLGGLLAVCGVLELAARLSIPIHPKGWFVAGPSDDRYFVPAPNLTYTFGASTFVHGPRGTPQGAALPEGDGRIRIAFVGDSVCYGFYASGEENLTRRVEAGLGAERFEVLNFGVPGYNAHMVSATLREEALAFAPKAVVYVFHQNDLTNASHADAFRARPALFRERYDLPKSLLSRTLTRSRALTFVLDRALRRPGRRRPQPAGEGGRPRPSAYSPSGESLRRLLLEEGKHRSYFLEHLRAMRAACASRGVAFALLFVPQEETHYLDGAGAYRSALAELCRGAEVPLLDGQAAFASPVDVELYGDPSHPNARGHAALAEAALEWLRPRLERP
tara:strand:- start:132 stop:1238 length:1107 start_codon:yes stop_codon:yes gene_type:complete